MTKVEQLQAEIANLSPEEFRQIAHWLAERDAALWDRQMDEDAAAGRLDWLWREAETEIAAGEARPLDELLDNP
ncbi:MAG: hypothetical protein HYY93_07420 [Planctomycetes bacterium]|nr:hypothetical protein [Planctomycetota bacterium]